MSEWIYIGLLVILVLVVLVMYTRRGGASNAMGYTSEHGYCPNMGACDGCDLCEED